MRAVCINLKETEKNGDVEEQSEEKSSQFKFGWINGVYVSDIPFYQFRFI